MLKLNDYQPSDPAIWQGREDSLPNERFFQRVRVVDLTKESLEGKPNETAIIGFCSDEGISRNLGRMGAKDGPFALRKALGKLSYHGNQFFVDLGNIIVSNNLEGATETLASLIKHCHAMNLKTLIFGGGHEIAWGHFLGLADKYPKLGILNFDAHFDLRPLPKTQLGNSGTPFFQIAHYCEQNHRHFHYACIGIQPHANTASLFEQAKKYHVNYLLAEDISEHNWLKQKQFLDQFLATIDALYLSICLDVFAEAYAPGVSAPQPLGLIPSKILPLLKYLLQSGKVISTDLAELSPRLDESHKTARLAAMIAAETMRE